MNDELDQRCRQGAPPFHGPVLFAAHDADHDGLTLENLLLTLRHALPRLHEAHGSRTWHVIHDWHEHDGFVNAARPVTWAEVTSWTQSTDRLRASCSDDWLVHTLLFPADYTFCLRYWLDVDSDEVEGYFDLCAQRELLDELASSLRADGVALFIEPSAKDYFERKRER